MLRFRHSMRSAAGFGLALLLPACSIFTAHATFTRTMPYPRSARSAEQVQLIFLGHEPARSFVRVAQLNAGRSDYQDNEDLFAAIRREAAAAGLDGVTDLQCGFGFSYAYQCVGTGFVLQR
jgi:hypothetical protein